MFLIVINGHAFAFFCASNQVDIISRAHRPQATRMSAVDEREISQGEPPASRDSDFADDSADIALSRPASELSAEELDAEFARLDQEQEQLHNDSQST
jgi:hypothetical protein